MIQFTVNNSYGTFFKEAMENKVFKGSSRDTNTF